MVVDIDVADAAGGAVSADNHAHIREATAASIALATEGAACKSCDQFEQAARS